MDKLTEISKIDDQLSRAILNGEYDKCKEILERDNVSVKQIYCFFDEDRKVNAFEECYRNMQRLEIAKLVSKHHTFDPNEKCIKTDKKIWTDHILFGISKETSYEYINILESLYKLYDEEIPPPLMDRISGNLIYNDVHEMKEFEKMRPFIDLLVFHPKMLESTIMDVIVNCKLKIFKNYLEQSLIKLKNRKAALYWLFCCQTRVFPFYPDLSKKIAEMIIE